MFIHPKMLSFVSKKIHVVLLTMLDLIRSILAPNFVIVLLFIHVYIQFCKHQ